MIFTIKITDCEFKEELFRKCADDQKMGGIN